MPSRQKEIFLLSLDEKLSSEEIAAQLNISKKSVDNYIGMARTSLRNFLSLNYHT
jgi:DNA-directed RNA polymerase specialized sigma24 family protein